MNAGKIKLLTQVEKQPEPVLSIASPSIDADPAKAIMQANTTKQKKVFMLLLFRTRLLLQGRGDTF